MIQMHTLKHCYLRWFMKSTPEKYGIAVTLNCRNRVDGEFLSETRLLNTASTFRRHLNSRVFGNRSRPSKGNKFLTFLGTIEGSTKRGSALPQLHCHCHIGVPHDWDAETFAEVCKEVWLSLDWAHPTENKFEVEYNKEGWISYMLKGRTKEAYDDSIALELTFINN